MGVLQQLTVVLDRPGRNPIELTPIEKSLRWTSLAVGGFGESSFSVPGDRRREMDRLSIARVMLGPKVLHEARVEDRGLSISSGDVSTTVRCFGRRRVFDDVSLRRLWLKRDTAVQTAPAQAVSGFVTDPAYETAYGLFDPADRSKSGFKVAGNGGTSSGVKFAWGIVYAPDGMTITAYRFTVTRSGVAANFRHDFGSSANGVSWQTDGGGTASAEYNITTPIAGATSILLQCGTNGIATVITTSDAFQFYNIALLGTSVTEDVPRGYYGGTLLRDLLAFCPDLQAGIIEVGSDFVLQSADYSTRQSAANILRDLTSFYAREWGVWEDGRFDWKTPQLEQEQWTCTIGDLSSIDLTESIDDVTKTTYLVYVDAATNLNREASATATDPRNPFVKTGTTRDQIIQPSFPMTSASASQLAAKLVRDQGGYVPVRGRVTLPVDRVISNVVVDDPMPALHIRGGENLRIADLPTTDPYGAGRDGETLFHIVSAEIDTEAGLIALDLEGLTRRQDVILARLAAATRTITG